MTDFKQAELQWAIQNNKPFLKQIIRASIQRYKEYLSKHHPTQLELFTPQQLHAEQISLLRSQTQ